MIRERRPGPRAGGRAPGAVRRRASGGRCGPCAGGPLGTRADAVPSGFTLRRRGPPRGPAGERRRRSRSSARPNNPTGTSLALADVERLCRASDGLVVIDEAYHEFSGRTVVPLLERHPNLVVLRTFSKAMALAGLRVGYLLASPELVREVNKARLPYNLNFFSQAAAIAALEEKDALADQRPPARRGARAAPRAARRRARRARLRPRTRTSSCSSASPPTRRPSSPSMLRRGVLVRDVTSYPMLARCLRVSVGTEAGERRLPARPGDGPDGGRHGPRRAGEPDGERSRRSAPSAGRRDGAVRSARGHRSERLLRPRRGASGACTPCARRAPRCRTARPASSARRARPTSPSS